MTRKPRPYPNLLAWRQARNLSQREAARLLKMSQMSYCRFERGVRAPKPAIAKRLMDTTGVSLEVLLGLAS